MVLADVAGHGEVVSAAAVRLRDALRQHMDHWDQSTLIRQLNDIKSGDRSGGNVELMKAVVTNLTQDDMIAIAAYLGSREP